MRTIATLLSVLFLVSACAHELPSGENSANFLSAKLEKQYVTPPDLPFCKALTHQMMDKLSQTDYDTRVANMYTQYMQNHKCIDPFSRIVTKMKPSSETPLFTEKSTWVPVQRYPAAIFQVEEEPISKDIPYVRINPISEKSEELIVEQMEAYKKKYGKYPTYFVLDLRNNPGGTLQSAKNILDLFAPRPDILWFTSTNKVSPTLFQSAARGPYAGIKLGILMNINTTSAAEVVAGSLAQNGALLIGEKTFGKGVYQQKFATDRVDLYLTMGEIFLGESHLAYHKKGLYPSPGMEVVSPSRIAFTANDPVLLKSLQALSAK